jgi:hypothetical protein
MNLVVIQEFACLITGFAGGTKEYGQIPELDIESRSLEAS